MGGGEKWLEEKYPSLNKKKRMERGLARGLGEEGKDEDEEREGWSHYY